MSDIMSFSPLWGEWQIKEALGKGSFGAVYKAEKKEYGNIYVSAVKHLSIPNDGTTEESLISEGYATDKDSVTKYYDSLRDQIINEINVCYALRGNANIVSYEDHLIVPKKDNEGYDIFIRMEYLTALPKYMKDHYLDEKEVIQLGIDICTALEALENHHMLHRDIKPANIFVSPMGAYKLGDFGESKVLMGSAGGMTVRGTYSYMSPEISMGHNANITADIYSLGIVMYRLLNGNRPPFMPDDAQTINAQIQEAANVRRFSGERIPLPKFCNNPELINIVMKACEFRPEDRWQTPREMRKALEYVLDPSSAVIDPSVRQGVPAAKPIVKEKKKGKSKKPMIITIIIISLLAAAGIAIGVAVASNQSSSDSKETDAVTESMEEEISEESVEQDPVEVMNSYLESGSYNNAVEYYNSYVYGNREKKKNVDPLITNAIDDTATKYNENKIDFEKAESDLITWQNLKDSSLKNHAAEKLNEIKIKRDSADFYGSAEEYIKDGQYVDAIRALNEIPEESDSYENAQKKIGECVDAIAADADKAEDKETYKAALDNINGALEILPDNEKLTASKDKILPEYQKLVKSSALLDSDAAFKSEDYKTAFSILDEALEIMPDNSELKAKKDALTRKLETKIKADVEKLMADGKLTEAQKLVESALEVCESTKLTELKKTVDDAIKKDAVSDIEITASNVEFWKQSGTIDSNDDEDKYVFVAPEKGLYDFKIKDMAASFYVALTLYEGEDDYCDDNQKTVNNSGFQYSLEKGKSYTISVKSKKENETGKYTLVIGQQKPPIEVTTQEKINDSVEFENQENNYYFTPEVSGYYRFDLSDVPAAQNVQIKVNQSDGSYVDDLNKAGNLAGLTVELKANTQYLIQVIQSEGFGSYTMKIGRQKPVERITGKNSFSGNLTFTKQQDVYVYTPPVSGTYKFTFSNMELRRKVNILINDSTDSWVDNMNGAANTSSFEVELKANQEYTIYVTQSEEFGAYTVEISEVKE